MGRKRPSMNDAIRERAGRTPAKGTVATKKGAAVSKGAAAKTVVPKKRAEEQPDEAPILDFDTIAEEVSSLDREELEAELEGAEEELAGAEQDLEDARSGRDAAAMRVVALKVRALTLEDDEDGEDGDDGE